MLRLRLTPGWTAAVLCSFMLGIPSVVAQDAAPAKPAAEPKPAAAPAAPVDAAPAPAPAAKPDPQQARAAYDAKLAEWKQVLKDLRQLQHDYQTAEPAQLADFQQRWDATMAKGEQVLAELRAPAVQLYQAAPNEDRELARFLVKLLLDDNDHNRYEQAVQLGEMLVQNGCEMNDIFAGTGAAQFALHNFQRAKELVDQAKKLNALTGPAASLEKDAADYLKFWPEEQEIRKKEAEADDLPRVKLTTNKGDIVLELFENEAPETVGNFISLVKSGFYDGLTFHRVLPGFMAQGGCPEGTGSGGPGYMIYDEVDKPGKRKHFRGSLSMAKTGAPNSGGSQFFLTFRPTSHLNGLHTVFGRVIEGMDVAEKLQPRDPDAAGEKPEPDKILKAEVLRDRGHEYLPHKVE